MNRLVAVALYHQDPEPIPTALVERARPLSMLNEGLRAPQVNSLFFLWFHLHPVLLLVLHLVMNHLFQEVCQLLDLIQVTAVIVNWKELNLTITVEVLLVPLLLLLLLLQDKCRDQ